VNALCDFNLATNTYTLRYDGVEPLVFKLNRLEHEWMNFDDHDCAQWISATDARIEEENRDRRGADKPLESLLSIDQKFRWRNHRYAIVQHLIALQKVPYQKVFMMLTHREQVVARAADNPLFIACLLRLLDDRTMTSSELERTLSIARGHIYRFFDRGGIAWKERTVSLEPKFREALSEIVPPEFGVVPIFKSNQIYVAYRGREFWIPPRMEGIQLMDYLRDITYNQITELGPPPLGLPSLRTKPRRGTA
jgi:hypothetical protein